jgi:hypothetical protein
VAEGDYATVAGGGPLNPDTFPDESCAVYDHYGTVSGGASNEAGSDDQDSTSSQFATVGGGRTNNATGPASTVGGGTSNVAGASSATVAGGNGNSAYGDFSSVGGGLDNSAGGAYSTVPGGYGCSANNDYSFATGRRAVVSGGHDGAMLFADSTDADFVSETADEFAVRANGGVRFISNSSTNTGVTLYPSGNSWAMLSSKSAKENFEAIDTVDILEKLAALPVERWNYIGNDPAEKHIGPYAEDFHAAFGLNGAYDDHITTQDLDGVALAAIQGLNHKVTKLLARIEELEARLGENER